MPCPITNCVGFLDGSNQEVERLGIFQHVLFNGHVRYHAIKWQGLLLPNGIMPLPFGPINGNRHDSFILEQSGLVRIMHRIFRRLGGDYCMHGTRRTPSRAGLRRRSAR